MHSSSTGQPGSPPSGSELDPAPNDSATWPGPGPQHLNKQLWVFFCAALHFLTSRGLGTPHAFRWAGFDMGGFDMGSNKLPLIPNSLAHLSWSNRQSQLWSAGTRAEVWHFKLVGSTFGKQYGANVGANAAALGCLLLCFAARLLRSVRSLS